MALLSKFSLLCPDELDAQPMLASSILHYLEPTANPILRDGALKLLVHALPTSADLQTKLGRGGAVPKLLDMVTPVVMGGSSPSGAVTPFSRVLMHTTSALKVATGLSASSLQDAVHSISILCAGDSPDAVEFTEIFGDQGGVPALLRLVQEGTRYPLRKYLRATHVNMPVTPPFRLASTAIH